jgi:hypothetical protein
LPFNLFVFLKDPSKKEQHHRLGQTKLIQFWFLAQFLRLLLLLLLFILSSSSSPFVVVVAVEILSCRDSS